MAPRSSQMQRSHRPTPYDRPPGLPPRISPQKPSMLSRLGQQLTNLVAPSWLIDSSLEDVHSSQSKDSCEISQDRSVSLPGQSDDTDNAAFDPDESGLNGSIYDRNFNLQSSNVFSCDNEEEITPPEVQPIHSSIPPASRNLFPSANTITTQDINPENCVSKHRPQADSNRLPRLSSALTSPLHISLADNQSSTSLINERLREAISSNLSKSSINQSVFYNGQTRYGGYSNQTSLNGSLDFSVHSPKLGGPIRKSMKHKDTRKTTISKNALKILSQLDKPIVHSESSSFDKLSSLYQNSRIVTPSRIVDDAMRRRGSHDNAPPTESIPICPKVPLNSSIIIENMRQQKERSRIVRKTSFKAPDSSSLEEHVETDDSFNFTFAKPIPKLSPQSTADN